MRHIVWIAMGLCATAAFAQEAGFRPLFDGKTLNGWDGDPRLWKVEDGAIVGQTDGIALKHNSFLISKDKYADFELHLETKLRNHNSGIQFRSEALADWVVRGLQADMAEGNWWGSIYDELGKRGTIVNGWKGKAETVIRPGWNDYEILCDGDYIRLKVNGLVTAELHDPAYSTAKSGILGLQLHAGPGMRAEFRNIRIKELRR